MYKPKALHLFIASLFVHSATVSAAKFWTSPDARDDHASIVIGVYDSFKGNVANNDRFGAKVDFTGSTAGKYGYLTEFDESGAYTYKIYDSVKSSTIPAGETVVDTFNYTNSNFSNKSSSAKLIISLSVVNVPKPKVMSDVEVEFNDRSRNATPLNSGKNILGHLHTSRDKDWYSLYSSGNEMINLELCPQDSACFGKKSWVLYVFDSNKLTAAMETREYTFRHWVDETGGREDVLGNPLISGTYGSSNHMYLAYRAGFFKDALIGTIDPCFGTSNSLNIGVGFGPRNYLIAISSPLLGNGNDGKDEGCGVGDVVLQQPALPTTGLDKTGKIVSYSTTREWINVFPNSDDQYSVTINGSGSHPLSTEDDMISSSVFNPTTGDLYIPTVTVGEHIFQARLKKQLSYSGETKFSLLSMSDAIINKSSVDYYRATYSYGDNIVKIPRVTDQVTGQSSSMVLQYFPGTPYYSAWLKVLSQEPI